MCGIAGIFDTRERPIRQRELERMLKRLQHRGPDGDGRYFAPPPHALAIGHTRLSIIDLSLSGFQPMANENSSLRLVCNGEIYNYWNLRRSLQRNHRFRGHCDIEVLLHLYEELGDDFLRNVNGMFALALWDQNRGRLLLARDRFGIKPLYWTYVNGRLIFASEIKAILAVPQVRARVNPVALAEHFTWQWTTGANTWFEGIHLLEPGHRLVLEAGKPPKTTPYCEWQYDEQHGRSEQDWQEEVYHCFTGAVRAQLQSDVPLGTYLSGGMDTGSISAAARRHIPGLHTFTCGFECPDMQPGDVGVDERLASRELANRLDTCHHEFVLKPQQMEQCLDRLVWHLDYPTVGISHQIYQLAGFVRRHVWVILSGTGGDELFAGYPWRYEPIMDCPPNEFENRYYRLWLRFYDDEEKRLLFRNDINRGWAGFSTRDRFHELLKCSAGCSPLNRALEFDFRTFLQGLLMVEDKLSMAHGLENRVPFLDNDVLNLVSRMPANLKAVKGESKRILRKAMTPLLPSDTLVRGKQGFTPPEQTWFRGPSRKFIHQSFFGADSRLPIYCKPERLQQIVHEFENGKDNHRQLIWSLLLLDRWHRLYLEEKAVQEPQLVHVW